MKRSIAVVLIALLVFAICGVAFAEEHEGGVEVEAGVKVWNNKWKSQDPNPAEGTRNFDSALLLGPAVEVKLPLSFYVEGSYLVSTNDYESSEFGVKVTSDRKDLDLAVGYRIIPEVGVFVGYKKSTMDWNAVDLFGMGSGSLNLSGPLFGVQGNVPVSDMFSVYASLAALRTKLESKAVGELTTNNNAPGTVWELGVKAAFTEKFSGTLGYKVESTKEKNTNIKDTFSGFTLGAMYEF